MPDIDAEPEPESARVQDREPATAPLSESASASGPSSLQLHVLLETDDLEVDESRTPLEFNEEFVQRCCMNALRAQSLLDLVSVSDVELSVQLLEAEAMRELNLHYRQRNSSTNVLSFESQMPVMFAGSHEESAELASGGLLVLGDLVLCPEVIAREASEQGKPLHEHWAHMLVHGTLHLCGYDHEEEGEAHVMESTEIRILSGLDIDDPYEKTNLSDK